MKIIVHGAGRMGHGAVFDLAHNSPQVEAVTVADADFTKAEEIVKKIESPKVSAVRLDVSDYDETVSAMRGHDAAISCVNYWHNLKLSKAAIAAETNFCDLGGNNYVADAQLVDPRRISEQRPSEGDDVELASGELCFEQR